MPNFVVEDGTGLDNSTSYVDIAFADDFKPDWAGTGKSSSQKEAALMEGTAYIDSMYGYQFKGQPLVSDQNLEFPRSYAYNRYGNQIEGVPRDLKRACVLYAQQALNDTLYVSSETTSSSDIKKKKTVVGPITTEVEYKDDATQDSYNEFQQADSLMSQYVEIYGGVIR